MTSPPRLTLQFHPDRPFGDGLVIEAMAREGVYRSQFVTGTSNGGLTAHPGGDRWRWESRLFAGRYDDAPAEARPVYGAWNRHGDPYGAAPRFGSCHVVLREEVGERATYCYPDSFFEPADHGGPEVLARLCDLADRASGSAAVDPLDDYVEAQVHGPVRFEVDVEAVVLDPCFAGGPVEEAARATGCHVSWHPGFRAHVDDLDPDYRGVPVHALALDLARDGVLVPSLLGAAAREDRHDPQALKRVWHCLARFGRAPGAGGEVTGCEVGRSEVGLSGLLRCGDAADVEVVRRHLPRHVALTRAEPGCLAFTVEPTDDPLVWRVEERFADVTAFRAHQQRVAASDWGAATAHLAREYVVRGLGTPARGAGDGQRLAAE